MENRPNINSPRASRTPRVPVIRVGQINAQNCRSVMDQLRQRSVDEGIDILAIQEPYTHPKGNSGLGLQTVLVTDTKQFTTIPGPGRVKAAIAIYNKSFTVLKIEQLSNTHFVCVEIVSSHYRFYLICAYFQFSDNIEPYLTHLDETLNTLKGKDVIVSVDVNAKSHFWHSGQQDDRGILVEDCIATHNLYVANQPSDNYTFDNIHGKSNIDITLATNACYRRVSKWDVQSAWTTSDHNVITFEIKTPVTNSTPQASIRYNISKANWEKFHETLESISSRTMPTAVDENGHPDVNLLANKLENIIIESCNSAIPKKSRFPKSAPWWNEDLTTLKREVRYARRQLQQARSATAREHLRIQYRSIRNKYIATIKKSKIHSWRSFVTTESNRDPWSLPYKLIKKKVSAAEAHENIKINGTQDLSWEETMRSLLNSLVPDDNATQETHWQTELRDDTKTAPDTENTPLFLPEEIEKAIRSLKNRKAPGLDLIEPEVIKHSWPALHTEITHLFNSCLEQGVFPRRWKEGNIRVLLKGEGKSKTDPKSYRPICLLPILGKVLEKLMSTRLSTIIHQHPKSSDRQFGFKKNRSTEDAIVLMRELTKQCTDKYAIALMIDITGAFDNVWWPNILSSLKARGCPQNLYRLTASYLSDRTVCIRDNKLTVSKEISKGCPQGSVLGPEFWTLIFDEIIELLRSLGFETIAFADDMAIIISGNSRLQMEQKANTALTVLVNWCSQHKLRISETKTEMLLIKGFLDIRRPPLVKVADKSLKMKPIVRYLGVYFGTRFNVAPHVNYIATKTRNMFNKLSQIAKARWGLNHRSMTVLYKGLFIPIITYAAAGWSDKLNVHHIRTLTAAQRHALLRVVKAYRTISNDALKVLAAAVPIELLLIERRAMYYARKNIAFEHGNINIPHSDNIDDTRDLTEIKMQIRSSLVDTWQTQWDQSTKGRVTYEYFKDIRTRLSSKWINPNFYSTQLLSGHGKIGTYLQARGFLPSGLCTCGQLDTLKHIIFECADNQEERNALINYLRRNNRQWPCSSEMLVQQGVFRHFNTFCTRVMRKREENMQHYHP